MFVDQLSSGRIRRRITPFFRNFFLPPTAGERFARPSPSPLLEPLLLLESSKPRLRPPLLVPPSDAKRFVGGAAAGAI